MCGQFWIRRCGSKGGGGHVRNECGASHACNASSGCGSSGDAGSAGTGSTGEDTPRPRGVAATLTRPLAAFQAQAMAMTFPPALPLVLPLVLPLALSLALTLLLCLPAPALAFWGDYGPDPAPELFGVRLGDDIRKYKNMEQLSPPKELTYRTFYQHKEEKYSNFEGIPLHGDDPSPYYVTYKHKIYQILFNVRPDDYEKAVQKIATMFGPPSGYKNFEHNMLGYADPLSGHVWLNSEVFVQAHHDGSIVVQWLPSVKGIPYELMERDSPVSFEGITLGGKIDSIYFDSMEIYHEGPELIHYMAKWALRGGMKTCVFSTYRGVVYGFTFTFKENTAPWSRSLELLELPNDPNRLPLFFGNALVEWIIPHDVQVRLTPLYWEANRARLAYYRNVKPD